MPRKSAKKTTKKTLKTVVSDPTDSSFFDDIRRILRESRQQAYAAVNAVMVEAYWKIGRRIVEEEQAGSHRAEYGTSLIRELSRQLGEEFGKGFSVANLKNFRQFYLTFPDPEKSYALRSQLTWTHLRLIMRVENPAAREFYIRETAEQNWSSRELERSIKTLAFERLLNAPEKRELAPVEQTGYQIGDFIKDPYVLEFLDLPEHWSGHEVALESTIIERLQSFLLELGPLPGGHFELPLVVVTRSRWSLVLSSGNMLFRSSCKQNWERSDLFAVYIAERKLGRPRRQVADLGHHSLCR